MESTPILHAGTEIRHVSHPLLFVLRNSDGPELSIREEERLSRSSILATDLNLTAIGYLCGLAGSSHRKRGDQPLAMRPMIGSLPLSCGGLSMPESSRVGAITSRVR